MTLKYYESEMVSPTQPKEVEANISNYYFYVRKNITDVTEEGDDSPNRTWRFDEAKIPKEQYNNYMFNDILAKIEYLTIMSDL